MSRITGFGLMRFSRQTHPLLSLIPPPLRPSDPKIPAHRSGLFLSAVALVKDKKQPETAEQEKKNEIRRSKSKNQSCYRLPDPLP
jgi:hypothetical protein